MKIWSWRHAIQVADIPAVTKLVLLNLSVYHNDRGDGFWPSYERQAVDTGLSRRAVIEHVHKAVDAGLLEKVTELRDNGSSASNRYFPSIPGQMVVQEVHGGVNLVHGVVQEDHQGSAGGALGVVQEVHPPIESIKIESIDSTVSGSSQNAPKPPTPTVQVFDPDDLNKFPSKALLLWPREATLPDEWGAYAENLGYTPDSVIREMEKFHAYWVHGKGNDPRKSVRGWRQAWNNWLEIASRRK